ncbi:MAG: hypothetical protein ACYCU8_11155 [Ferrimicrobium acidiphilum]
MRDGGDWPSSVGLRGQALNHLELRWLKTVVVSVRETAHEMRQVGIRKTCQNRLAGISRLNVAIEASSELIGIKTGGPSLSPGMSLAGVPFIGQVVLGVEAA